MLAKVSGRLERLTIWLSTCNWRGICTGKVTTENTEEITVTNLPTVDFRGFQNGCILLKILVGERGFEPPTPWSRTRCSTRLSHSPTSRAMPPKVGRAGRAAHRRELRGLAPTDSIADFARLLSWAIRRRDRKLIVQLVRMHSVFRRAHEVGNWPQLLLARQLFTPLEAIDDASWSWKTARSPPSAPAAEVHIPSNARVVDFGDAVLAPGLIDIHIHGGAGHDVMEGSDESLAAVERLMTKHGVTSYCPTTVTAPIDATLRSLDALGKAVANTPPATAPARVRWVCISKVRSSAMRSAEFILQRYCSRHRVNCSSACGRPPQAT